MSTEVQNKTSSQHDAKLPVMRRFIDIVQNDKKVFIGHLDTENYIEIQYVGCNQKGLNSY